MVLQYMLHATMTNDLMDQGPEGQEFEKTLMMERGGNPLDNCVTLIQALIEI